MTNLGKNGKKKRGGTKKPKVSEQESSSGETPPPYYERTWVYPLFALHNLHKYVCACIFPCIPMNSVRHMIDDSFHWNLHNNDVQTAGGAAVSVCVDIPCIAGAMVFNHHFDRTVGRLLSCRSSNSCLCCGLMGEEDDNEDEEEEEEEGGWWSHWQNYAQEKMSKTMALAACIVYPLLICPLSCLLRRQTLNKLEIHNESTAESIEVSCCLWPCSLVQMEDELRGDEYNSQRLSQGIFP